MGTRRDATPRTSVTRLPELARSDRAALDELLDGSRIGHFGIVVDGFPVVVPTAIARRGDAVLAHGSTGSGWMRGLAAGAPTTLAVTALDGLEVARSSFESSMHYRSAILFGSCRTVDDADEKRAALDAITDSLLPGRVVEVRGPTPKELAATLVLLLPIEEWSLKVSAGWPDDAPADLDGNAWAGIVPLTTGFGQPVPAPDLRAGIEVPASVRRLGAERH
jgi:nitroimidazol reductase NimA-like FMN-containing flavoprotein (pyridoxamine 5'-phosphate oxidase superfamily)